MSTDDALFDTPDLAELRARQTAYDAMGVDATRTVRRNQALEAGVHPTTRRRLLRALPDAEKALWVLGGNPLAVTCGDCAHCETKRHGARNYIKCGLACDPLGLNNGPGTDTRKKWPACSGFESRRG